jgi:hypothetical protein
VVGEEATFLDRVPTIETSVNGRSGGDRADAPIPVEAVS